ncbi:hypothetical protein SAMN05445756_1552 [Kytococcus aerolatus]|uniref:Methyltransferase n=1 Tax=Kytococcus aerolatus TaxID=592308 RepID=A0A212U032_9MICO|nr:hypothetical protein [Kytococcus aerolatus]SNC71598.1 hypothetical protein SAMN05445756_1552 [Kytococcus aerolatus]
MAVLHEQVHGEPSASQEFYAYVGPAPNHVIHPADLAERTPAETVSTILECGPGIGQGTLLLARTYPGGPRSSTWNLTPPHAQYWRDVWSMRG